MIKTYKYRLYPNANQQKQIDHSISVCRLVYNLALDVKTYAYKSHGISLTAFDLCYQLVDLRREYPWISTVCSQSLQAAVKKIDISFRNFFRGGGYPKFQKKQIKGSFYCPAGVRRIDWNNETLTIPKIKNIPIRISRKFKGDIKTVTIIKTPTGKYFASIFVDVPDVIKSPACMQSDNTLGIDVGIKSLAVLSDGTKFDQNSYLKNSLTRLRCLSKRVSRKKKGSFNRKKAAKRLSVLHEKISNQRLDYIHKVTTSIVRDSQANSFVIEDLNISGLLQNRSLSRSLMDAGIGYFFEQMKYKCRWANKNLVVISRFEPTSKKCSNCGELKSYFCLDYREWTCDNCDSHHDRDINAAINIKIAGIRRYSGVGNSVEPVESCRLRQAEKQEDAIKGIMPIPAKNSKNQSNEQYIK